jgi:predicted Ser/Thr protein kinase
MWEYYIQKDGKVRRMSERHLRDRLRKGKYSGMELVRRADESQWRPLHETLMFTEEVPMTGSPIDYARWRTVRGFGIHFLAYIAVNILTGFAAPIFLLWGIAIVLHGVRALPPMMELYREGKIPLLSAPKRAALQHAPAPLPPAPRPVTAPQQRVAPPPRRDTAVHDDPSSGSMAFDPTIDVPPPKASASASARLEDQQLRASVRGKLFGGGEASAMKIGRYRLDQRVGAGGMGMVYRAHDETLDRAVAVKVLRSDYDTEAGTERLQREARAMARLAHPNVVTVFDVGTFEGAVFVAMEFVDGVTLREWLDEPHAVGDVLAVLRQAAEGLAAAHHAGLVHRDFKPENVIVGRDGRVRVLDFGLAKPIDALVTQDLLTVTGTVLGTPRYMSPEQFRGEPADAKSDQFSFGVVAYEAMYGTHPYEPIDGKPLPRAVLAGKLRPPPARVDVPVAMREALLRAVAHDPDKRFESIAAMLEAFGPMPTTTDELGSLAAAVRRLLMRRTGAEAQQMLRVLDSIEQVVAELDAKAAALARQTKPEQAAALARELEDVQARREAAKSDADRDLLQQQIDSLQERLSGIDRAREVVDRLRTRRSVAENHLQQLHLDLMRAEASATDLPDLTGPLQELRYQVDAAQEVEALLR